MVGGKSGDNAIPMTKLDSARADLVGDSLFRGQPKPNRSGGEGALFLVFEAITTW